MPHPPCLLRCYHANKWHVKTTLFLFLHLFVYLLFLQEFNFGAVWCFCIHYSAFCCSSSQKGWHHNATLMQNHKTTWNEQTTTAYNGTHLRPKPCPIPWIDTGERSWPGVNHVLLLCYFIFDLNVNSPLLSRRPMVPDSQLLLCLPPHLHKWILHHSQDRYGCASCLHLHQVWFMACPFPTPTPTIRPRPSHCPLLSWIFLKLAAWALAECLCVCLSFSLMSTLISFLSPALLPVCCRSSYFTPTGTNTPHYLLHIQRTMKWKRKKKKQIQCLTCCELRSVTIVILQDKPTCAIEGNLRDYLMSGFYTLTNKHWLLTC